MASTKNKLIASKPIIQPIADMGILVRFDTEGACQAFSNNIKKAAKPKAIIVFSGILVDDESKIIKVLQNHDFIIKSVSSKNNWLLITTEL